MWGKVGCINYSWSKNGLTLDCRFSLAACILLLLKISQCCRNARLVLKKFAQQISRISLLWQRLASSHWSTITFCLVMIKWFMRCKVNTIRCNGWHLQNVGTAVWSALRAGEHFSKAKLSSASLRIFFPWDWAAVSSFLVGYTNARVPGQVALKQSKKWAIMRKVDFSATVTRQDKCDNLHYKGK